MSEVRELNLHTASTPLDDSRFERPPIIQRTEIVTFCLIGLLLISVTAVLYVGRAFFLPIVTAIVVGTMLSPAAKFLERYRIPRSVSAVAIVTATFAGFVFMIGLISAPVMEWTTRLPELGPRLKDKFHVFDRPIAMWHQLQAMFGTAPASGEASPSLLLPKVEWVQPTLEFLSPTFTEILLFFAVLVLFIASWPNLRRALVLTFGDHESRLRMLRILNAIETHLGSYLLTVTMINMGVGIATGIICAFTEYAKSGRSRRARGHHQLYSDHRPDRDVRGAAGGRHHYSIDPWRRTYCRSLLHRRCLYRGPFRDPMIIGRRLALNALAVFIALAFWTWLWGPMGAFLSSPF